MPVISQGPHDEEMEKRLGAAVMTGQPLVCIDNVARVLRGDALAQIIERSRPQVRILGKSELVEVEAVGITLFANGNNLIVGEDLTRRVIRARLDTNVERPELREFTGDPIATVLNNRGAYVAACLTICRAYAAAGRPDKKPRLASFEGWSDTVRSALCWLGMEDPVASMEGVRGDDPDRSALEALFTAWANTFGTGESSGKTLREVIETVTRVISFNSVTNTVTYAEPELRAAVLTAVVTPHKLDVTTLGYWMRQRKDRIVGVRAFANTTSNNDATKWWIKESESRSRSRSSHEVPM
jgi:hypothetical protein